MKSRMCCPLMTCYLYIRTGFWNIPSWESRRTNMAINPRELSVIPSWIYRLNKKFFCSRLINGRTDLRICTKNFVYPASSTADLSNEFEICSSYHCWDILLTIIWGQEVKNILFVILRPKFVQKCKKLITWN